METREQVVHSSLTPAPEQTAELETQSGDRQAAGTQNLWKSACTLSVDMVNFWEQVEETGTLLRSTSGGRQLLNVSQEIICVDGDPLAETK